MLAYRVLIISLVARLERQLDRARRGGCERRLAQVGAGGAAERIAEAALREQKRKKRHTRPHDTKRFA